MIDKILGNTKVLEKALDAAWTRNDAIAQNIANVDTPGYKRKVVTFEKYLNDAMDKNSLEGTTTDKRHIPISPKNVDNINSKVSEENKNLNMRLDQNNVDIDYEMAELAKNNIKYNTLTQKINSEFQKLKSVIKEGR